MCASPRWGLKVPSKTYPHKIDTTSEKPRFRRQGVSGHELLLMDAILHHLGALNYCNSQDFRDLRWCKISSINSRSPAPIHHPLSSKPRADNAWETRTLHPFCQGRLDLGRWEHSSTCLGLGFKVLGLGFRLKLLGFRVSDVSFRA